ncbi:hypothetical protein HYT23_01800 [Candidatus Pacearchaeota archaeon]|nr:hypothetical protein [Candidatus Pacearchaeota archaeon]
MGEDKSAIRLDYVHGSEQPYKAKYIGWQTPPVHPRLGLGGIVGNNSRTYGSLIRAVLWDLRYLSDEETPELILSREFRSAVGQDLENLTLTLLSRNILSKLRNKEEDLHELIRPL